MTCIELEHARLTDRLWEVQAAAHLVPCESTKDKAFYLRYLSARDNPERMRLSLLDDLLSKSFWHAADSLLDPCLWPLLTENDSDLYLRAILHQAQNSPSKMGYGTILRKYDEEMRNGQERLEGYVDKKDLQYLVTRAFCEFANRYYTSPAGIQFYSKEYHLIETYFKYIDFPKTADLLSDKPLVRNYLGLWPTQVYRNALNNARKDGNLDNELGARLAYPIIEQILCQVENNTASHAGHALETEIQALENYREYFDNSLVQSLLRKWSYQSHLDLFEIERK